VIKPRLKPAIALAILGLSLTGAILGSGIGRQDTAKSADAAASTPAVKLSLPPSTVSIPRDLPPACVLGAETGRALKGPDRAICQFSDADRAYYKYRIRYHSERWHEYTDSRRNQAARHGGH
jgi:hypothetical protein